VPRPPSPKLRRAKMAKNNAIPVLHRDYTPAKVPGPCPDAAPGNTTSPYCRAVICKVLCTRQLDRLDKHAKYNSKKVGSIHVPGLPTRKQEFGSSSLQPSLRCKIHAFLPTRTSPPRRLHHDTTTPIRLP
jgi:hypothetical protein